VFSGWRDEDEAIWGKNALILSIFHEVVPYQWESEVAIGRNQR
jgi:hypothetical protein